MGEGMRGAERAVLTPEYAGAHKKKISTNL